jgi:hypothetical protein
VCFPITDWRSLFVTADEASSIARLFWRKVITAFMRHWPMPISLRG